MTGKNRNGQKGFTLVELLVVMAIMAVLIGISVAGLGYAMRKSRNIARSASASNLNKALASYYADEQRYPPNGTLIYGEEGLVDLVLLEYLEGSWDEGAPNTVFCYEANPGRTSYVICVSNELSDGTKKYFCHGPGVGTLVTSKELVNCESCGTNCGGWKVGDSTGWATHDGGIDE